MIRRVSLALLVCSLVACGDDGTGDDGTGLDDIVGTYVLQSIDGEELPVVVSEIGAPDLLEITAGNVILSQDMTCSERLDRRATRPGRDPFVGTKTDVCSYTFSDGAITLTFPADGTILTGSITGSTLTSTDDGSVFVYEK